MSDTSTARLARWLETTRIAVIAGRMIAVTEAHDSADGRVETTLKAMIEVNLARQSALAEAEANLRGAWFSNGVIFSKSGNTTPFSNGIIFSKTGRVDIPVGDPAEQIQLVEGLAELDQAAFNAFTERLLRLKQVKAATQIAEAATQITERGQ